MLKIENLHAEIDGKPILKGLTLSVNAGEAVDDQRHRRLLIEAAAHCVEELVLADLRGRRLMLDLRRGVLHLDIGHGMRAALIAEQQRIALREVADVLRRRPDADQPAIGVVRAARRNPLRHDR